MALNIHADAGPSSGIQSAPDLILVDAPLARNGQTLEGILVGPRQPNSLFAPKELSFAGPPRGDPVDRERLKSLRERFERWDEQVKDCSEADVDGCFARLVTALHRPPFVDFAKRKTLPRHVPTDRHDPIALIVTAVQLLHDALPNVGRQRCIDTDRLAYVRARLLDAERVQVAPRDARFSALKLLSSTIATVLERLDERWAHLEAH